MNMGRVNIGIFKRAISGIALVMGMVVMYCVFCVHVYAESGNLGVTIPANGVDGNLSWSIDSTGLLTITGDGDYENSTPEWCSYKLKITSAKVQVKNITTTSKMFYGCENMKTIDLSGLDTSKVTDMSYMFYYCSSVENIDVSKLDFSKVTNMMSMFYWCRSLKTLDLSKVQMPNVTNMNNMFLQCEKIKELDMRGVSFENLYYCGDMFIGCSTLKTVYCPVINSQKFSSEIKLPVINGYHWIDEEMTVCTEIAVNTIKEKTYTKVRNSSYGGNENTNIIYSGKSGDLDWSIDDKGLLLISGTGNYELVSSQTNIALHTKWSEYADYIKSAKVNVSNITDTSLMFQYCSKMTEIDLSELNTSKVTEMSFMFDGCESLESIDVSRFNTDNVTNMRFMFDSCISLKSLDLSAFDTSNVTDMGAMFQACENMEYLDVRSFDTSKVIDMSAMFGDCCKLKELDLTNFDTGNVTNMFSMFYHCTELVKINISSFKTGKVTDMCQMFSECYKLQSIDVSMFDTNNVTNMSNMFSKCKNLYNLDISRFSTNNLENINGMFAGASLWEVDLSNFNMDKVNSANGLIYGCMTMNKLVLPATSRISTVDTSADVQVVLPSGDNSVWKDQNDNVCTTISVRQPSAMTYTKHTHLWDKGEDITVPTMTSDGVRKYTCECGETKTEVIPAMNGIDGNLTWSVDNNGLLTINGSGDFVGSDGKPAWYKYARYVKKAKVSVDNITNAAYMFADCSQMTSIDLTGLDTSKVTDMKCMFYKCSSLEALDVSRFVTENVTSMDFMFYECTNITVLDVNMFDTSKVASMQSMFCGCKNLLELDLSGFNTENVTYMVGMFADCQKIKELDLSSFNTSNVDEGYGYLFTNCYELKVIDLSSFDGNKDFYCFIEGAHNLRQITMPVVISKSLFFDDEMLLPQTDGFEWYDSDGNICEKIKVDQPSVMTYTRKCAGLVHTWDEGAITTTATATSDGIRTYTCTVCGETKTETIHATGGSKTDTNDTSSESGTVIGQSDTSSGDENDRQPPIPSDTYVRDGLKITVGNGYYQVSSVVEQTVTWIALKKSNSTSVTVPEKVVIDGKKYRVTKIADNAFKNNKKIKKVIIGKNISSVGKNAFADCKKLKTITIKSSTLNTIEKNAFKNINKKVTIKVPKKQYKKYKKLITAKKTGYKKTMKIKK